MKTFLETSALVVLHFRSEKQAIACREKLEGKDLAVSAYVLFELARGPLARLIELHELSYGCENEWELREKIKEGRASWTRQRDLWTDALDDDLLRVRRMNKDDAQRWRALAPQKFRARLRLVIEGGWTECAAYPAENPCGCRPGLPAPRVDHQNGGHLEQELPTSLCGTAGNCGVLSYVRNHREDFKSLHAQQSMVRAKKKASEREKRLAGMAHLLGTAGEDFDGEQCHASADAIISHEAHGHAVATKDGDLKAMCQVCGTEFVHVPHR